MSVPPSVRLSFPAVVSRLRAAGCVFAEDEAELLLSTARSDDRLAAMVEQRVSGLPLEQVLGWAELCGLRIAVDPGVFVPRRRSEFLVRQAAALAPPTAVVVDLCCGTGALGVALAATLAAVPGRAPGSVELYAADIEPAAVRCASRNVAPFGGRVFQGDLYRPLPAGLRGRVDVLIANAPYVPTEEIGLLPAEARLYEPQVALDGGADGLDVQRRVAAGAQQWLAPGGCLLIETSERQAELTAELFARSGLLPRIVADEEWHATVVIGSRPGR
jgi:release factor glutamine methyltransferase